MATKFGIGWQVGGTTGWGVYGLALTLRGAQRGLIPVPVYISSKFVPDALEKRLLSPLHRTWIVEKEFFSLDEGEVRTGYPFLMGLGNDLSVADPIAHIRGEPETGVVFFEHRAIPAADVARARDRFAGMIAGSSWNAQILRELGFSNVVFCPQGIDPTRFHPAPRSGALAGRFVVFSGGKLEFRKGQDIAVEAFRRFHARHPEALLMCAWHNHWDLSVDSLRLSPHRLGRPGRDGNGPWRMTEWLSGLGIPSDAVIDLGEVPHEHMPRLLRECDAGLFPNRCEGGTNLVAMECMACGVPVLLSRNTGHLDLLERAGAAIPLNVQGPVTGGARDDSDLFLDWGESDPDEIVERLEWVRAHRAEAAAIGRAGADFMREWAWTERIDALFAALGWG